jgi:hypothetical protein
MAATPWRYDVKFDGGTPGNVAGGPTDTYHYGFPGSTGVRSFFADDIVYRGTHSCKMTHLYRPNPALPWDYYTNVSDDWGECMGTIGLGNSSTEIPHEQWLTEGDEFWYGAAFYFKPPWKWGATYWGEPPYLPDPPDEVVGGHTKIMRMRSRFWVPGHGWTGNGGILSLIARTNAEGSGGSAGIIQISCEPAGWDFDTGHYFDLDRWMWIEFNVKLGAAGAGHFRAWKDGQLIFNDESQATWRITSPTYGVDALMMSQWNGGCPDTPNTPALIGGVLQDSYQDSYHDEIVFTDITPTVADKYGHPMIGPPGWVSPQAYVAPHAYHKPSELRGTVPMYTAPETGTYEYSSVGKGFIVTRWGAGQTSFAVTGIGQVDGTVLMATPKYIGAPDGPGAVPVLPGTRTLSEMISDAVGPTVGDAPLPFGPRPDRDLVGFGGDEGGIVEFNLDEVMNSPIKLAAQQLCAITDAFDMGIPALKNIYGVTVNTDLRTPLTIGILSRMNPREEWREAVWNSFHWERPTVGCNVAGIWFKVVVWGTNYERGRIGEITVSWKLQDMRHLHSNPELMARAR